METDKSASFEFQNGFLSCVVYSFIIAKMLWSHNDKCLCKNNMKTTDFLSRHCFQRHQVVGMTMTCQLLLIYYLYSLMKPIGIMKTLSLIPK